MSYLYFLVYLVSWDWVSSVLSAVLVRVGGNILSKECSLSRKEWCGILMIRRDDTSIRPSSPGIQEQAATHRRSAPKYLRIAFPAPSYRFLARCLGVSLIIQPTRIIYIHRSTGVAEIFLWLEPRRNHDHTVAVGGFALLFRVAGLRLLFKYRAHFDSPINSHLNLCSIPFE